MKVVMVVEGYGCSLRIEPQDEEGRALLAAFGVKGNFQTRLAPAPLASSVSRNPIVEFYEGAPAVLD